jgi:hypothetical protein
MRGSNFGDQDRNPAEPRRRKSFRLPQAKIDRAREVLGTRTETETIERALDLVVFRADLMAGVRAMRGVELIAVFDDQG